MVGIRIFHISKKHLPKQFPVKDIDSHGCQITLRLRRFLLEFCDFSAFFGIHDTKTACFFHRNLNNGDGCICMMFFVVSKHLIVVHLVNMVTRKNQQIFRCIGINKVNVLRNSIRSSSVYVQVCICFFPWWQNIYAAVFGIQTPSSSCGCITVQQDGFVLSQYADYIDSTVCTVTQWKINDPIFSAV